jgi:hypothetical protein
MEIAGIIYEATLNGIPFDVGEGAEYMPSGIRFEETNLATRKTVAISRWQNGELTLPIIATGNQSAAAIINNFNSKMASGGSTIVLRTATKTIRALKCFLKGDLPKENLSSGEITNVSVSVGEIEIDSTN